MLKEELRLHYAQLRGDLSNEAVDRASISIANRLLTVPLWSFSYYHIFLQIPDKKEINTQFILSILSGKDKNIVVPKVMPGRNLHHYLLTDSTRLRLNRWGIPEPEEGITVPESKIQVVFLPLLAFDLAGHRVGYGSGFYDNFLAQCNPEVIKVGLSMFEAVDAITDAREGDIAMDYCVTPDKVYNF